MEKSMLQAVLEVNRNVHRTLGIKLYLLSWLGLAPMFFDTHLMLAWVVGLIVAAQHEQLAELLHVRWDSWPLGRILTQAWHRVVYLYLRELWRRQLKLHEAIHVMYPWVAMIGAFWLSFVLGFYAGMAFGITIFVATAIRGTTFSDAVMAVAGFVLIDGVLHASTSVGLFGFDFAGKTALGLVFIAPAEFLAFTFLAAASRPVLRMLTFALGYKVDLSEGLSLSRRTKTPEQQRRPVKRVATVSLVLLVLCLVWGWQYTLTFALAITGYVYGDLVLNFLFRQWTEGKNRAAMFRELCMTWPARRPEQRLKH